MSWLRIFAEDDASAPLWESRAHDEIAAKLSERGVRYERWEARAALPENADDRMVIAAYQADIARLQKEMGYQSVDVVRLLPDNPKKAELRQKFLDEHTHAEDEVRFFVEGQGMFYMRIGAEICMTLCARGTLISVPAGVRHWFDMGEHPRFTAIRLFTNADGWIAQFTGDAIAARFPRFHTEAA